MSRHIQARFLRLLLGLAISLGCASGPAAAELRLAVSRGPVSLPLYVADAKGYFAAESLAVKLLECHSGRECFQQIQAGTADMATSAELIVALDSLKAASAVIVATISSSAQHIKLVARRSAGIQSPADLRGKRIGTVARTSAHYFLDNWLLYHDIGANEVTTVALGVQQLVDELAQRRLDAIAIWEPTASDAAARLGLDVAKLPLPRVYTQHFVLSLARGSQAGKAADVQGLLRALLRAEAFIATRPQEAADILAERLRLDAASARAALREHDYRLDLTPTLLSTMDGQSRWAIRERLVEGAQPAGAAASAIAAGPLRQVSPKAVSLPTH